ncbi:MAG: pyridoxamine 5'-phosphate oxidase family protein [Deltaproteobacteria bacterium]|nr:pyridoxamine 5'-phosphate oxidase family protein [Deltaproteobacteria bacterium]
MSVLPDKVSKAWDDRKGPIVFTTVDGDGVPNAIYATCVRKVNEDTIVVADNYFDKTRKNIFAGSRGAILFITPDDKSYQLKGPVEYHTEGDIFEDMKRWNPKEHPGHAAAVLKVEEVYAGAKRLA